MSKINLQNIIVEKHEDKNSNIYYVVINNDNKNEAFFCFDGIVKEGGSELVNNYGNITGAEIEFETNSRGNKRVINLYDIKYANV